MAYDPNKHHRRSIRLRDYDYSLPGKYFVTICVQQRKFLFGEISGSEMNLNAAGRMIEKWWCELAEKFPLIELDEHITMPNHFHGIIEIIDRRKIEKDWFHAGKTKEQIAQAMALIPEKSAPLPEIVQWFKTMSINEYIRGVKQFDWPRFEQRLWQRNYYEHVILNLRSAHNIRQYIRANPLLWSYDRDNPKALTYDRKMVGALLTERLCLTEEDLDFIHTFDDQSQDDSKA